MNIAEYLGTIAQNLNRVIIKPRIKKAERVIDELR